MNILILNWRDPKHPNAGGAEQVTMEHAKGWRKAGHSVTWFSSAFTGGKEEEVIEGIKVLRNGRQYLGVQIKAFFWYFLGKHRKFDLVIDQFHGIPFFTPLYVRVKRLSFIHEIAGKVWKLNPWPRPFNFIPYVVGTLFEPWLFKTIYRWEKFMTVSSSTMEDLANWGIPTKNISVVPNGVKLNHPKVLPKKEERKTVIFLGVISADKGIDDAIITAGELAKRGWQIWFVGKYSPAFQKQLEQQLNENKAWRKARLWGFVSDRKKFELLARAHVMVNPSVHEGWGLVNIEAASVGTPVVGYDVAGVRDSVVDGKTGMLCVEGETGCLADTARRIIQNNKLYMKLSKESVKWSKTFDWGKQQERSLQLIEGLI